MNIFFVTESLDGRGGWGRYSLDLLGALEKQGVGISVLSTELSVGAIRGPIYPYLPVKALRFNLLLSNTWAWIWALLIFLRLKLAGVSLADFDLLYCVVEPYLPITERLARLAGKPYGGTIHGSYGLKPFRQKRQGQIFARALSGARQIICVSHYTKNKMAEFVEASKFAVIPNGIKTDGIAASSPAEISVRANLILSVGALKERKAQHLILAALPTLRQSFPDLKCVLVAGATKGAYGEKIKRLVADSRLEDCVSIKEKISDQELDQLYRRAKIFALLPVSEADNFEGFGLVYLEANLRALPVIGAYGSGAEEAIALERSGFLVDSAKPEELIARISQLLQDQEQYRHLAASARAWALEHDIDLVAKRYLELFKAIKN